MLASNRSYVEKENGEEAAVSQSSRELNFGDFIWVSLHGSLWWPAQVIDENTVSRSNKPCNKSMGEVLVRLYGSYTYLFVDPVRCCFNFENILKENNGSYCQILKKTLEQDLFCCKSGGMKGKGLNSKGTIRIGSSQDKRSKNNKLNKRQDLESQVSASFSPSVFDAQMPSRKWRNGYLHAARRDKLRSRKRKQGKQGDLVPNGRKSISATPEASSKKQKKDGIQKKVEQNSPSSEKNLVQMLQELSVRRMKVMKTLGLIAPSGSPFHRNRKILS